MLFNHHLLVDLGTWVKNNKGGLFEPSLADDPTRAIQTLCFASSRLIALLMLLEDAIDSSVQPVVNISVNTLATVSVNAENDLKSFMVIYTNLC